MKRTLLMVLVAVQVGAAHAQVSGAAPEAKDMTQVGFDDLQGRSAYQPLVREQNGRWILYVGHHGGTDSAPKPVSTRSQRSRDPSCPPQKALSE